MTKAEAIKQIENTNICKIHEIFDDKYNFYIVTEILHENLVSRLQRRGFITELDAVYIIKQILGALEYLHRKEVIHGNLKFENFLMTTDDPNDLTLKITDCAIAKIFEPEAGLSRFLLSPFYLAPEAFNGDKFDSGVDVWAAGVIMHLLITGEPPFIARTETLLNKTIKKHEI